MLHGILEVYDPIISFLNKKATTKKVGVLTFGAYRALFVYLFRCLLLSEFRKFRLCEDWKGRNVKPVSSQGNQDLFDARNWESSRRDLITALPVPWFDLCGHRQQYLAPEPSITSQPASGEFLSSWWRSQPSTALSSMLRAGNPACSF